MAPTAGYCINCDNRHGCKSRTPPCVDAMGRDGVKGCLGKEYLTHKKETHLCMDCSFFRSCWSMEEFDRLRGGRMPRRHG